MLGFIVLATCIGTCLSQNTGIFATISKDLRDLFQNSYSTVTWTSDTTFVTEGYPHYQVECVGLRQRCLLGINDSLFGSFFNLIWKIKRFAFFMKAWDTEHGEGATEHTDHPV